MELKDVYTAEEKKLLDALGRGEIAAKKQRDITAVTGLDARTTRYLLESARKKGAVVCGSSNGRYLPESLEELRRYVQRENSRVRNECISLAAARRLLKSWEGGSND